MLKNVNGLIEELNAKLLAIASQKDVIINFSQRINEKYNLPEVIALDYLQRDYVFSEENAHILFWVVDIVLGEEKINEYYTKKEIEFFAQTRYKKDKKKFAYHVIKVDENQYIGKITLKELMQLRDMSMIAYNKNTQRVLKLKKGTYKISINKTAVRKIEEAYSNKSFIPNTITLNIPIDADVNYDESTFTLNISNITSFDIIDGYHRYLAMSTKNLKDDSFDYNMEIRFVMFPEEKAKQFIYQEDQKTKMTKSESRSFNNNSVENKIVKALSLEPILVDKIGVAKFVDSVYLAELIKIAYGKDFESKKVIEIEKQIKNYIQLLLFEKEDLLNDFLTKAQIACLIFCSKYNKDYDAIISIINDKKLFTGQRTAKDFSLLVEEAN